MIIFTWLKKNLWGIYAKPSKIVKVICGMIPIFLLIGGYLMFSNARRSENKHDKLAPSISKMVKGVDRMAFTKNKRTGDYLMLRDTLASLRRFIIGVSLASIIGLFIGIGMGLFPALGITFRPIIKFLSIVPPVAILPILLIFFGVGELGKIVLIFIGCVFVITLTISHETQKIPQEQIVKLLTLGASQFQVVCSIIPQIMPVLLVTVRICLGLAWILLLLSEGIASTDGLGYRIFLVRRYLSMDVIIPYVLWITCLGIAMDSMLRWFISWKYPWYVAKETKKR